MKKERWIYLKEKFGKFDVDVNSMTSEETEEFIEFASGAGNENDILFSWKDESKRLFYRIDEIKPFDRTKVISLKSGVDRLDKKIGGFNKGELTIVSGSNGSGKSSLLSQWALEFAEQGYKTAIYSGELPPARVKDWLMVQAAGKDNLIEAGLGHYVDNAVKRDIEGWINKSIFIYNNTYSMKPDKLIKAIELFAVLCFLDVLILDNLMSLDMTGTMGDKYERQTVLTMELSRLAKKRNLHIFFVCHPRKSIGFLRKNDISGTADITNAADNVMIVHRVNNDFKRATKEFFGFGDGCEMFGYDNVVEICKNRDLGIQDYLAGVYYEHGSKRFKNDIYEYKRYGWEPNTAGFEEVPQDEVPDFGG